MQAPIVKALLLPTHDRPRLVDIRVAPTLTEDQRTHLDAHVDEYDSDDELVENYVTVNQEFVQEEAFRVLADTCGTDVFRTFANVCRNRKPMTFKLTLQHRSGICSAATHTPRLLSGCAQACSLRHVARLPVSLWHLPTHRPIGTGGRFLFFKQQLWTNLYSGRQDDPTATNQQESRECCSRPCFVCERKLERKVRSRV